MMEINRYFEQRRALSSFLQYLNIGSLVLNDDSMTDVDNMQVDGVAGLRVS